MSALKALGAKSEIMSDIPASPMAPIDPQKKANSLLSDMKNGRKMTADGTFRAETGRKSKMQKMFNAMEKDDDIEADAKSELASVSNVGNMRKKDSSYSYKLVTPEEIRTELRHKFLTILKA